MQHTVGSLYAALGKLVKEGHGQKVPVVDRSTLPDVGRMVAIHAVGIAKDSDGEDPGRLVAAIAGEAGSTADGELVPKPRKRVKKPEIPDAAVEEMEFIRTESV